MKRLGRKRACLWGLLIGALAAGTTSAGEPSPAGAAVVPPEHPSANYQPLTNYSGSCAPDSAPTASCPAGLGTIDALRAAEGVVPMTLPTNFSSLTTQEQIYVVANLERVDRGLPPVVGLSPSLDADAQAGAVNASDPALPPYGSDAGANWGQSGNIFSTDQLWMYEDGWSGDSTTNEGCTSPGAPGCWAHRDNILGAYPSPSLMGTGAASVGASMESVAEVFVGTDMQDSPDFDWSSVTTHLPVGVGASASISSSPGSTQGGSVELWASGEAMNVGLSLQGGNGVFSLATTTCDMAVGQSCAATVDFTPPAVGEYAATLSVSGPNGVQDVPIEGVSSRGYRLVGGDGGVFTFGGASYFGSTGDLHLNAPIVSMAATPDDGGYWLVAADGGIFSFGDAGFYGSASGLARGSPVVGIAATPDGGGYWLVAAIGAVFGFGDAAYRGSAAGLSPGAPIVGIAPTPDGGGYWLVASDGAVFSFGDASFFGAADGLHLNAPIVGMAPTPDGGGYWLVGSDGGVFGFGDAAFYGSTGGLRLNAPIVGMAATPDGGGYWLVGADGGVFNYGDAGFYGSTGATRLNSPVVGLVVGQPGS